MATPPKGLPASEIVALRTRIIRELRIAGFESLVDCGDDDDQYPLVNNWRALTPQVQLLVRMLMRIRAASSRVGRARIRAEREAASQPIGQVFDDGLRDKAYQQLKAASLALRNAEKAFDKHAENVEQLFRNVPIDNPLERGWARIAADLGTGVEQLMQQSRVFDGYRDIASASEWDELLTDFAMELSDLGFSDTKIAELLLNMVDVDAARSINQRRRRRRARG